MVRAPAALFCLLALPGVAAGQPVVEILSPGDGDCVNGGSDEPLDVEAGGFPRELAADLPLRLRLRSPDGAALQVEVRVGDDLVVEQQVAAPGADDFEVDLAVGSGAVQDGPDQRVSVTARSGADADSDEVTIDVDRLPPAVVFDEGSLEAVGACLDGAPEALDYEVVDAQDDAPDAEMAEVQRGCLTERSVTVSDHCAFGGVPGNTARVVFPTRSPPADPPEVTLEGVDEGARVVSATLTYDIDSPEGCVDTVTAQLVRDGAPAGAFGSGQRLEEPGAYRATVEVTPCGGDAVTAERAFTIVPPPEADPGGPYEAPQGGELTLSAAGTEVPEEVGEVVEYAWDLDADGFFDAEEGRGVEVPFDTEVPEGAYPVGLRVTTDGGASR